MLSQFMMISHLLRLTSISLIYTLLSILQHYYQNNFRAKFYQTRTSPKWKLRQNKAKKQFSFQYTFCATFLHIVPIFENDLYTKVSNQNTFVLPSHVKRSVHLEQNKQTYSNFCVTLRNACASKAVFANGIALCPTYYCLLRAQNFS